MLETAKKAFEVIINVPQGNNETMKKQIRNSRETKTKKGPDGNSRSKKKKRKTPEIKNSLGGLNYKKSSMNLKIGQYKLLTPKHRKRLGRT